MTTKQMLNTWGYLRALADLYQQCQNKLIKQDNELSLQASLEYDQQIKEINSLLQAIDKDIASMPDEIDTMCHFF